MSNYNKTIPIFSQLTLCVSSHWFCSFFFICHVIFQLKTNINFILNNLENGKVKGTKFTASVIVGSRFYSQNSNIDSFKTSPLLCPLSTFAASWYPVLIRSSGLSDLLFNSSCMVISASLSISPYIIHYCCTLLSANYVLNLFDKAAYGFSPYSSLSPPFAGS